MGSRPRELLFPAKVLLGKEVFMQEVMQDLLLFLAITVPPILLGFLLHFGLNMGRKEEVSVPRRRERRGGQKHPYHLQP
jgi:hypothetical protein